MIQPWRCRSRLDGHRCQRSVVPHGRHVHREGHITRTWSSASLKRETYETTAPWITWTWLSTDRETRVTGRMRHRLTCCVCGKVEVVRIPIPRFGKITPPPGGIHPARLAAIDRHAHPDRGHPMSWALPLRNLDAHPGGMNLDLLGARLEADMNEDRTDG